MVGYAVAQLVEAYIALLYKQKDLRINWWDFSQTSSFWLHHGTKGDSASNRKKHQQYLLGDKGGRCVGLTTLQPSCLKILAASISWNPKGLSHACKGTVYKRWQVFFYFFYCSNHCQLTQMWNTKHWDY
jgi:hypothetical protein